MEALDRTLSSVGLRSVEVPSVASAPTGIGGQATVVRSVLVPISPGGVPGVINFLVIQSNVPPLLSVGLLEHLGASFDLVSNHVRFEKIGVQLRMGVQTSGHRTIPLVQWTGGHFPVPDAVKQEYGLSDTAFDKDSAVSSPYIKETTSQSSSVVAEDGSRIGVAGKRCHRGVMLSSCSVSSCEAIHVEGSARVHPMGTTEPNSQHLGSGSLLMGNHLGTFAPQFARDPLWKHGSPLAFVADPSGKTMESLYDSHLLPHGDLSHDVLQADPRRARSEEHQVGSALVPGELPTGPWCMPSPVNEEPREPVRELGGVSELRSPALLLFEEGRYLEGQGEGPCEVRGRVGLSRGGRECYSDPATTTKEVFGGNEQFGSHEQPSTTRPVSGHPGDVPGLPADECGHDRSRPGAGPDAADHEPCQERTGQRDGCDRARLSGQDNHRDPDGLGRRADRGFQSGGLVGSEHGQPIRRCHSGPPGLIWPRWMTLSALSLASSVTPWGHLSAEGRDLFSAKGGNESSWLVHYPLSEGTDSNYGEDGRPPHLRVPWVMKCEKGSVPGPRIELWHELRDPGSGGLLQRGPGPPPQDLSGRRGCCWHAPRHLQLLETHRDPEAVVLGFDDDGLASKSGPFWLVHAPLMGALCDNETIGSPEIRVDAESERSLHQCIEKSMRQEHREGRGAVYDFVAVISATPDSQEVQRDGLRVPPPHEDFTDQVGWECFNKDHRQRFREFHERCRPTFIALTGRTYGDTTEQEQVRAKVEAGFIIEIMEKQATMDGIYYMQAPDSSSLWKDQRWDPFLQGHPGASLLRRVDASGQQWRLITNGAPLISWWSKPANGLAITCSTTTSAFADQVPGESTRECYLSHDYDNSEEYARVLRQRQDYSSRSCLRLLNMTRRQKGARSRKEALTAQGLLHYEVYGQYSHGGMSGTTRRTEDNCEFVQYINELLTRRGATGPRSSFAVSSGARLSYHRDNHNLGINYVLTIGDFTGGQVWVEEVGGPDVRQVSPGKWVAGRLHSPRNRALSFSPRQFHGPEPWQGDRWSIIAYQTRSVKKLTKAERRDLRMLGFDVRGYPGSSGLGPEAASAAVAEAAGRVASPFPTFVQTVDDDEEELDGDDPEKDALRQRAGALRLLHQGTKSTQPRASEAQISLIRKLHNNCGHPPADRFLRTLKAAGALPHILRYVRDKFHCQECDSRRGPLHRRKAQCPRLFTFNRVLSVDVFYIRFQQANVPILNMVCSGTNYQVVQRLEGNSDGTPSSYCAWKGFLQTWVRYLGAPQMVICDGGSEFKGHFERGLEQLGVLQHLTIPESPWQNSKSERHGGWLKERLQREVDSGQCSFGSMEEMDEFLASITAAKNRWFNQGGYTPVQLVFGELPRVPAELLSEDQGGLVPLSDAYHDPAGLDESGAEFRKRIQIRERAKQAAMEQCSREALSRAVKTSSTPSPDWRPGQWVYVFRRGRPTDPLVPKARWVGPGMVLVNARGVVWVAMRSRLWRCSPQQLRAAFPTEVLGHRLSSDGTLGELLRQVTSGNQSRAVDVAREGPPTDVDELAPVSQVEGGIPLGESVPLPASREEDPQAPQAARPVPSGLLPRPVPPPEVPRRPSVVSSRRSSATLEEPAQEPEGQDAGGAARQLPPVRRTRRTRP